jgi:predicted RNA-binding Zn-ribbon protein involved in translation (DUF1610 family)
MSRKYRQPGYQDSAREEPAPERRPPPALQELTREERIQRRSLRHATAREANEVLRCHQCGRNIQSSGIVQDTVCPHCAAHLHCCRTCRNFDSSARWQCRAAITQPVADKSAGNDCALHAPRVVLDTTGRRSSPTSLTPPGPAPTAGSSAKEQFDSLFKR